MMILAFSLAEVMLGFDGSDLSRQKVSFEEFLSITRWRKWLSCLSPTSSSRTIVWTIVASRTCTIITPKDISLLEFWFTKVSVLWSSEERLVRQPLLQFQHQISRLYSVSYHTSEPNWKRQPSTSFHYQVIATAGLSRFRQLKDTQFTVLAT